MKKGTSILVAVCSLGIIGAAIFATGFPKKMSSIETDSKAGFNGSFEQVKNGLPINWYVYTPKTVPNSDFDISYDTHNPQDGLQSLLFTVRNCAAKGGWHSPGLSREVDAKAGDVFKVSLWVRNNASTFRVNIAAVNATQSAPVESTTLSENIAEWRKLEYTYTIPKGMKRLRIEINVLSPGSFTLDNVIIAKV